MQCVPISEDCWQLLAPVSEKKILAAQFAFYEGLGPEPVFAMDKTTGARVLLEEEPSLDQELGSWVPLEIAT